MDNPIGTQPDSQQKKTNYKRIIKFGCGGILLLLLTCIALYFIFIVGISGEAANASTAEKVSQQFVGALHDGNIETAHKMLSDFSTQEISVKNLSVFSEEEPILKYENLKVCEFQVFYENTEKILTGLGIIYYEGGSVKFQVDLHQDEEKNWKVLKFILIPEFNPELWGRCNYERP